MKDIEPENQKDLIYSLIDDFNEQVFCKMDFFNTDAPMHRDIDYLHIYSKTIHIGTKRAIELIRREIKKLKRNEVLNEQRIKQLQKDEAELIPIRTITAGFYTEGRKYIKQTKITHEYYMKHRLWEQ